MAPKPIVYIDTSLGTHLVMALHIRETVSSFKNRLLDDHRLSFPDFGDIEISGLKVKDRSSDCFYNLSDTMFVTEALEEIFRYASNYYLFLEVKKVVKKGENLQLHRLQFFRIPPDGGKGSSPSRGVRAVVHSLLASLSRGCSHF